VAYPPLTITYLGTGTSGGVPMIGCSCRVCTSGNPRDKRLRSSIMVRSAATTLTVDAGPDFRQQMLREQVQHLDGIIFTHSHKDHVAGLDDVRAYNFWSGRPMDIYASEMTQDVLIREFPYAFADTRYPGVPEIRMNTIGFEPFMVGDIPVTPVMVWHLKMPVMGFRFGDFTYITDANRIDPQEMDKIRGSRFLTLNALRKEQHISHFTLQEGVDIAREVGAGQTFFTHMSHQMGLHEEINKELPADIQLAYDGLVFSL
jgi:phosphoribosyl 1,2-cyclic phosphate phosphodiesterase